MNQYFQNGKTAINFLNKLTKKLSLLGLNNQRSLSRSL